MVNGCCAPKCRSTHMSCYDCPTKSCELSSLPKINLRKINKQVRQDSSLAIMKKRVGIVSKQVGSGANPSSLAQAGGPGDLTSAIQKCGKNGNSYNDGKCTYRMFQKYTRVQNKGKSGVDKKHGSYARYLARRIGGELRKEKMPGVVKRTAYIKQPRNRTGTNCGVTSETNILQGKYKTTAKTKCYNKNCCNNRIPTTQEYNARNPGKLTGFYGSKFQLGSQGGRCGCCTPFGRNKKVA